MKEEHNQVDYELRWYRAKSVLKRALLFLEDSMNLKDTLLMPNTSFEMRGNLSIKEPIAVKKWHDEKLYQKMLKKNAHRPPFILHDGPPYANGDMHVGHMLNHTLKDIVIRYKNMAGYHTPYILGWDTHGLPIENNLAKKGVNRKLMDPVSFRLACEQFALEQVDKQKEQLKRLGIAGDFEHPYLTLDKDFEAAQIGVFAALALKGLIYKGLKPVYWSPSSETALAEAEIEYADVTSPSIYVAFPVIDGKGQLDKDTRLLIWTTTPWTLPANLGISVHPDFQYGVYDTKFGKLVFLTDLQTKIQTALNLEEVTLLKTIQGKDLELIKIRHPFYDKEGIVMVGNHVTSEDGTGLVHTAPGHGDDDYKIGLKYGLQPYCPVDSKGVMTVETGPELAGLFYEKANEKVLELLKNNEVLLASGKIVHAYPHDWRTGKPLIYRATPQWFASISPIREQLLDEVNKVNWIPEWGQTRMHNMIADRRDWVISRQRAWGVPIPIIYNEDDTPIMEKDVFDHIQSLFAKHGSNIWFSSEVSELLPKGYKNVHSPSGNFKKEVDIMDVWFDSGSSSFGVLKNRNLPWPADLYLEGSDQYRGWFQSSLILGVAAGGSSPYRSIISHGWVVDGRGEKMSKSKGTGIDPNKWFNVYGADVMRLLFASSDYTSDVRTSEEIIKGSAELYRKIRNTFKFLLGSLSDKDGNPQNPDSFKVENYEVVDTFILASLDQLVTEVNNRMEVYDFASTISLLATFISRDISSFYVDIVKDILYCESVSSLRRRQVQNVLYTVTETLIRLLLPFIPFTMEEAYTTLGQQKVSFAQLLDYPLSPKTLNKKALGQFRKLIDIRTNVLKELEIARQNKVLGSSQEARLDLSVSDEEIATILSQLNPLELARYFIVSKVNLKVGQPFEVKVTRHEGVKCDRCWNYQDHYHTIDELHLCDRCFEVVKNHG